MDIYEKAGVKRDDVLAWAHKTYPQFENNEKVVLQLYVKQVKKVEVPITNIFGIRGKTQCIADMDGQVNKYFVLEGLIGPLVRETSYIGCKECGKKLDGGHCPTHGKVPETTMRFNTYFFGDNTGDVEISLGPRLVEEFGDLEGQPAKVSGKYKDDGTLTVSAIEKLEGNQQLEDLQAVDNLARESAQLKEFASKFPNINMESIQLWYKSNSIKSPLGQLMVQAGVTIKPEAAAPVAAAPASQPAAPVAAASAPVTPVEQPTVDEKEKAALLELKQLFGKGIPMPDLTKWHGSKKLKTPLPALIAATGATVVNDTVVW